MDSFFLSILAIATFLSNCGKCQAYKMAKEKYETILTLGIVFLVVVILFLLVLAMLFYYVWNPRHKSFKFDDTSNNNKSSYNLTASNPSNSTSYPQKSENASVYQPHYEDLGPRRSQVYENPGVDISESRIEQAEEPHDYENLDSGKKEPSSFVNPAYESGSTFYESLKSDNTAV